MILAIKKKHLHLSKYVKKSVISRASKIFAFTKQLNNAGDMGITEKT